MTETEKEIYKCYKNLAYAIINQARKDIKSGQKKKEAIKNKESAKIFLDNSDWYNQLVDFITG